MNRLLDLLRCVLACCVLAGAQPALAQLSEEDIRTRPSADIEARLPAEHPAAYYVYALRLFGEDRKDDAVFWFYAGQLRYRFHLKANPNLPPGGDPALMASLNYSVGEAINGYAGGDPQAWAGHIDRVLEWDAQTDNGFTSKRAHAAQWQAIRSGLASLRDTIRREAGAIRQQREQAGVPNR